MEKPLGFEILNLVGGKEPVQINQFINWIEELTGENAVIKNLPFNSIDMFETMANIKKSKIF